MCSKTSGIHFAGVTHFAVSLVAGLLAGAAQASEHAPPQTLPVAVTREVTFVNDAYPLLKTHCFRCHAGQDAESGYRLDLRAEILGETNGEPLVVVGNSAESRLIRLVARVDPKQVMPPKGEGEPLSDEQVGILRAWIDQGLKWDDELLPPLATKTTHWAFQPIERPVIPEVANPMWVNTPVDAFVAAEHESRGLRSIGQASRRTLIRRVSLDLIGLPLTPGEIDAFVNDDRPEAYEQLVDRLLGSPRYGERWGRHWLDVARWAESEGYESNHMRPYAWRYRDYVIRSFNIDKPYDRFLREQLAGDELLPYSDENLIATGFLAAARLSSNEEDKKLQRNSVLVDIVNATGESVLGLTIGCAQCHNHKFDPITQRDYYALQGLFVQGQVNNLALRDEQLWNEYRASLPAGYDESVKLRDLIFDQAKQRAFDEARKTLSPEMMAAVETPRDRRTPEQQELARQADLKFQFTPTGFERRIPEDDKKLYDELNKKIAALEKQLKADQPQTWGYYSPASSPFNADVLPMKGFYPLTYEPETLRQTRPYILVRGDVHRRGPEIQPGWPSVFGSTHARRGSPDPAEESTAGLPADQETFAPAKWLGQRPATVDSESSGRAGKPNLQTTAIADRSMFVDWLTDRSNPLTARVWVNRIWQHHFGRGIVATPGDFGVKGAVPTHPHLLDYLACELIDSGWSTKHVHRLIVLSSTYRQASRADSLAIDPDNLYLWRWTPQRLESEVIRDAALSLAGELNLTTEGKSDDEQTSRRRSVYVLQKRDQLPEMQRLFDGPTANESCSKRYVSTVALQPLYLLNSPFMLARAEQFAQRVISEAGDDLGRQVDRAFLLAFSRPADDEERAWALEFLASTSDNAEVGETDTRRPTKKLVQFCHALMNLNEFVYLE
jgi:hypothetical protein